MTQLPVPSSSLPDDDERDLYYYGLPSKPRLVARSSSPFVPWKREIEDMHLVCKQLRPVGNHAIVDVWHNSSLKGDVRAVLASVEWNSIDFIRVGYSNYTSRETYRISMPVVLWVGVKPHSLTPMTGLEISTRCREELLKAGINDVHCEIRESVVSRASISTIPVQLVASVVDRTLP